MSKEELASKEWSDLGFCNNEQSNAFKLGYLKGYHQAEKDLELGLEDIEKIVDLYDDVYCDFSIDGKGGKINAEEHYQEVLKRFKSYGKKEI